MKQIQYEKVRKQIRELVKSVLDFDNIDIWLFNEEETTDGHKISLELHIFDLKSKYEIGEE